MLYKVIALILNHAVFICVEICSRLLIATIYSETSVHYVHLVRKCRRNEQKLDFFDFFKNKFREEEEWDAMIKNTGIQKHSELLLRKLLNNQVDTLNLYVKKVSQNIEKIQYNSEI